MLGTGDAGIIYEIKFESAPPVDAFWSLTIYHATDKLLVANPINRYKIGSDTPDLITAPDGSITILISHNKPEKTNINWLPAPNGIFSLFLRLYQPTEAIRSGKWPLPEVVKL